MTTGKQRPAKILSTQVLYDQPGKFAAWPSIARSATDELLVVCSGDRRHHVDPFGKILLLRSSDQGANWSRPQVIVDSPYDDRDPGIVVCPDGSWLVSLFTSNMFATWPEATEYYGAAEVASWQPYVERLTPELESAFLGQFTLLSKDRGQSWSPFRRAPVHGPHGPALVGRELLYLGTEAADGEARISCHASTDQGESWQLRGVLSDARALMDIYLCEPHLVALGDGTLLGQLRVNSAEVGKRQLLQSFSRDGGRTWSQVENSGLWGLPPHLLRHSSGLLLTSYGHRRAPFGQRVAMSADGGRSWPKIVAFGEIDYRDRQQAEDVGEIYYQVPDLGYPATVELADGSLYTVWYQSRPDGRDAVIHGCCWELPV